MTFLLVVGKFDCRCDCLAPHTTVTPAVVIVVVIAKLYVGSWGMSSEARYIVLDMEDCFITNAYGRSL
jgi:hypothetical protein